MADEGKSNTLIWVLLALVVLWFVYQSITKKVEKSAKSVGTGIGSGATHTLIKEGIPALGSFLGGLFGSKGTAHESDDEEDDEGGYDTSSFRVYDDE